MREIKFRAWDKERKVFWYSDKYLRFHILGFDNDLESCDFVISDLEQYIGLKDKNGKEIFEGDNIKYLKFICTVKYINGHYYLDVLSEKGLFWFTDMTSGMLKIIGNIHET